MCKSACGYCKKEVCRQVNTPYIPDPQEVLHGKVYAICAYLSLLILVPILGARHNRFAMYHANQGFVLLLCQAAAYIIRRLPLVGFIGLPLEFVLFIFLILGIVNAARGLAKPLPIIGGITLLRWQIPKKSLFFSLFSS